MPYPDLLTNEGLNTMTKEKTFESIEGRKIFEAVDGEGNLPEVFFNALQDVITLSPENIPLVLKGFEIDAESGELAIVEGVFDDGTMRPMISKLTKRIQVGMTEAETDEDGKVTPPKPILENVCRAVVVSPVPTLESLLAHTDGRAWIEGKLGTELNQITMRALRDAEDVSDIKLVDKMPQNIDDFMIAKRSGGKVENEAFNDLWKDILDALKKHPVIGNIVTQANLRKTMFEKVLSNRAYALAFYANLENADVFASVIKLMIQTAEQRGMDTAILQNWNDTRNDQTYEVEAIDLDSFDLTGIELADEEEAEEATDEAAETVETETAAE